MSTENLDAILDQLRMHFVRIIESEKGQHRATTEVLAEGRAALKVPEHEPIVGYAKKLVAENEDYRKTNERLRIMTGELTAQLAERQKAAAIVTGRLQAEIDELKDEKRFGRDAPGIPVLVEALRDDCGEPVRRVLVRLLDRMGGDVMGSSMCTIQQLEDECHDMIRVHEERAVAHVKADAATAEGFESNLKGTAQALSENIARVNLVGGLVRALHDATATAREMLGHLDKQIQDVLNVDGAHLAQGIEHPGREALEAARELCLLIRGYGDPVLGDARITAARTRLEVALGLREKPKGREVTFDAPLHTGAKTKLD